MTNSPFIVVEHHAIKARLHFDLRFKMPNSKSWMSFAVRKGVPLNPGSKVLAVRTHDHSEKEALFLGKIDEGYGAGELKLWDKGDCEIVKFGTGHIVIKFMGKKVKGLYHLVSTGVINRDYKRQTYILFKGKEQLRESSKDVAVALESLYWSLPSQFGCPENYTYNFFTKKCVKDEDSENDFGKSLSWSLGKTFDCPDGTTHDPFSGKCIDDPYDEELDGEGLNRLFRAALDN